MVVFRFAAVPSVVDVTVVTPYESQLTLKVLPLHAFARQSLFSEE